MKRATTRLLLLFLSFVVVCCVDDGISSVKKVGISEVIFDSPIIDIIWCGADARTVITTTANGRAYKSLDGGRSWADLNDLLVAVGGDPSSKFEIRSALASLSNKGQLVLLTRSRTHFVSIDAGTTFVKFTVPGELVSWTFHPSKPNYALYSYWTDGCSSSSHNDPECYQILMLTKSLGKLGVPVTKFVVQYSWGETNKKATNKVREDFIYFSRYNISKGPQPNTGGWSKAIDFYVSKDFGATSKFLVPMGNKFLVSNKFILVATLADEVQQTVNMFVSTDGNSFKQARIPESLYEKSYTILDTSGGFVILHVNKNNSKVGDIPIGNVYISDESGIEYSLSLSNNIRTASGECEFDKVLSLDGVYIANYLDINENENRLEKSPEDTEGTSVDRKRKATNKAKAELPIKTVISFDNGGKWSFLDAPKVDSVGAKINCHPNCYLNLHGVSNYHQYAPFYSVSNAIGLIIGTGNIGPSLRFEQDQVNTFLSRDGGLSWSEAHRGAFIYEFGDHGGLTVMADDLKMTNEVVFSWNEGITWYDFKLGETPFEVDNVVIEPNSSGVEFLLYGTRGGNVGVLYHLHFGALGQPSCKGVWAADSVSSDYETWTPSDGSAGRSEGCLLGRRVTYTRRKQTSECFHGKNYLAPVDKKNCECRPQDFECKYGFRRLVGSNICTFVNGYSLQHEGCTSSSFFFTQAYRKVSGDSCQGGWEPVPVAVPCPATSPFSKSVKSLFFFLFFLGLLLTVGGLLHKSSRCKRLLKNFGFESYSGVAYGNLGNSLNKEDMFLNDDDFTPDKKKSGFSNELDFIDSEQDDHNAPSLMPYVPIVKSQDILLEDIVEDSNRDSDAENIPLDPVPRLLPPPTAGTAARNEFELL